MFYMDMIISYFRKIHNTKLHLFTTVARRYFFAFVQNNALQVGLIRLQINRLIYPKKKQLDFSRLKARLASGRLTRVSPEGAARAAKRALCWVREETRRHGADVEVLRAIHPRLSPKGLRFLISAYAGFQRFKVYWLSTIGGNSHLCMGNQAKCRMDGA